MNDVIDTGDAGYVEEVKRKQKNKQLDIIDAAKSVLSDKHGRRLMLWILQQGGVSSRSYVSGASIGDVAYNEGRRSLATEVWDICIKADPQALIELLREQAKGSL